jgi:pimeloyl-ACP methyl ester carboxylesterase
MKSEATDSWDARTIHGVNYVLTSEPSLDSHTYVLLHGMGNSLAYWAGVLPLIAPQAPSLAVDIPGFGGSQVPDAGLSLETISSKLIAVLTSLGIKKPVLVAHSLGGLVALDLAHKMGRMVPRLIRVSSRLGGEVTR